MSTDPNRLESIFLAASELTEAERSAYLDEARGPDAKLRAAVDRLLAAHGDPASILKSHAAPPSTDLHNHNPIQGLSSPAATPCSKKSVKAAWARSGWHVRLSRSNGW
jgi:hypothetical protein